MKYATRTCHECGCKRPQPDMLRQTIEVETGYTQRSLSTTEVLFTPFSKNAQKSVTRRFTSPNKRKHIRNKEVWMCYSCAGVETPEERAEREANEKIVKALAAEKKRQDDAEKKAADDVARIAAYRRVATNYGSYWSYALWQLPLYCFMIYIPIVPMRMGTDASTCFFVSLLYYMITVLVFRFAYHDGFRWELLLLGAFYAFVEWLIYSSAAKKGRKIPPPLPKGENL